MATGLYTLRKLVLYFLKLGAIGFGGPVALIGHMHTDLVEQKKWIREDDYREGLALAQLAPGPLAAQLAIYLGYVHYRIIGATLAGIAFVLPSFLMVLGLGYMYTGREGLPWMQAIFYGIGAAVIGIIAISSFKLSKRSLGKDGALWMIFLVMAVSVVLTEDENIWLILSSGFLNWFLKSPPKFFNTKAPVFFLPFLLQAGEQFYDGKLMQLAWFFLKAGTVVFGSGLAIVPFLYGSVVNEHHWLTEKQFLDAVAVAMITPGPVVITVGFIGYLVDGVAGACIAALAVFLPCYLFTILPAPYFRRYGNRPSIKAFVTGITTAAFGAIAGSVIILAKRQFVDLTSVLIAVATFFLLFRFRKIPEPFVIIAAALAGLFIKSFIK